MFALVRLRVGGFVPRPDFAFGSVALCPARISRVCDAFGRGVSLPDPPVEAPTLEGGERRTEKAKTNERPEALYVL